MVGCESDWVQVLVGSQAVAVSRPALLAVLQQGLAAPVAQLTIPTPLNFTQASMQVFVDQAIASWGNPEYVSPNGLRTISPWPRELFPWPGNNRRCPASERREQWYLFGTTELAVPPFTYDQPHNMVSTLRFLDDYILFSPWKVEQSAMGATLTSTPLAGNITLSVVTEIKVWVGMVALAACQAWMIDKEKGLQLTYQEVYRGSLVDLVPDTPRQLVAVTVYDTAAPEYITLPAYGGMWYIWASFGMAAIWLFGLGLLILIAPVLIWWNVRDNRGLPPITYRYMKRFRGW
ncbi:hypothetical protein QJQ45_002994 [Haematococcus lacustris]|nr:hypothetical protein QJQ45_002994 [Haematococcus lacustris]